LLSAGFGQDIGLGGEWGGAVLLAVETPHPTGAHFTACSRNSVCPFGFPLWRDLLLLSRWLTDKQFFTFGWRLPSLASAVLVRYE
jgi:hypothetical protein